MKAPMNLTVPGLLTALAALLLGACSGGAPTTQSPNLQAAAQTTMITKAQRFAGRLSTTQTATR